MLICLIKTDTAVLSVSAHVKNKIADLPPRLACKHLVLILCTYSVCAISWILPFSFIYKTLRLVFRQVKISKPSENTFFLAVLRGWVKHLVLYVNQG